MGGAVLVLVAVALLVRGSTGAKPTPAARPVAEPSVSPARATAPGTGAATIKGEARNPDSTSAEATTAATGGSGPALTPRSSPVRFGLRRYAQTWVNVRGDRTRSAPTVAMLNPGDAVTVDSLVRGWYRVLMDGRTLGYVHRSTLDVSRPE